ncbi:glucosidase family protein [Costertonia aggregata]|uniref:Glycogen debranching protein n=1 Tax=Costertonia aggregata TaxID=343403 RepID=A0A7H9AQA3_9FLAO|nr:glycogen debranching protein [Costertonia aggregata]QLG45610.1 glycogen debranching protein [Costertonia aggregata]
MKKSHGSLLCIIFLYILGCSENTPDESLTDYLDDTASIQGKDAYLESPYVTAGDRVYMVGHQDGSFPELGWHIKGEMGGIWNHPIKLMDGFDVNLTFDTENVALKKADTFVNYPFGNKHIYNLSDSDLKIERFQFVPDGKQGIILQYLLKNSGDTVQKFGFEFTGHSDLRPTWLGERTKMIDGQDTSNYLNQREQWLIKDMNNPWFLTYGAKEKPMSHGNAKNIYKGLGVSNMLKYDIHLEPNEARTLTFTIAGSYHSKEGALKTYDDLGNNTLNRLSQKKERYVQLAKQSKLTVPDKNLEKAFEWLKYNCDWLVRTVPEIGTGITAGIPDYPWWFGVDSEYALKGYMAIGQTNVVYKTIHLLDSVSKAVNGNGKIIHEMSTNGTVFNNGNINETPQFVSLIWEVYQWDGNKEFLQNYFPTIKKGLHWLMAENDTSGNLFPDGFGMMEIHGLDSEMIDVASYTQRAFSDAAKIALVLEEMGLAKAYKKTADILKKKINDKFWSEGFSSYADFLGTDEQALHLIDDAIVRADTLKKPWAVSELQNTKKQILKNRSSTLKPFVLHHNWVVNTPMEMLIADSTKAIQALNTAEKFVNPFGVFVTGIDRDDSAGSDDGSFKGSKVFSYTGAVMTLPTGVQAVAENNYGRPDKALNYLNRMTRTFSYALPGSMYEVSPDYGMMAQAWNIYSYAIPIVQQFFGIKPQASKKKVVLKPQMPSKWNKASLENVKVADNAISVYYEKKPNSIDLEVSQTKPDWEIEVVLPKTRGIDYTQISHYDARKSSGQYAVFSATGDSVKISIDIK